MGIQRGLEFLSLLFRDILCVFIHFSVSDGLFSSISAFLAVYLQSAGRDSFISSVLCMQLKSMNKFHLNGGGISNQA